LKQPRLAKFLKRLAKDGRKAFYEGATPKDIIAVVNATGGKFDAKDFTDYKVRWLDPIQAISAG
jgi:gamma-glutamyltranspeptidase / glutathione hydrolase